MRLRHRPAFSHRPAPRAWALLSALTLLLSLPIAGCGGGSNDGENAANSFFKTASFTSGVPGTGQPCPLPGNGMLVRLVLTETTNDTLTFTVRAEGALKLYDVAFDLRYDSAVLRYSSATLASGFGNSTTASVQAAENPPGDLVFGATRLGAVGGVSGTFDIAVITFNVQAKGTTNLTYDATKTLVGHDEAGVAILNGSNFCGGTLVIQ